MYLEDSFTACTRLFKKKNKKTFQPFSHPLAYLLSTIYHRPSIALACRHAFSFALLVQGAPRWQITTRQPVIFNLSEASSHTITHTHFSSWPYPLPSPASIQRHSNSRPSLRPHLFPPAPHIFHFLSAQKSYLKHTIKKKKTQNKTDIVTVEAFKSERQIVLYYDLDL